MARNLVATPVLSGPLLVDAIAFVLFLVLALGYHVFYLVLMRRYPEWSARHRMHQHRVDWVDSVLKRGERIMAVQALRNLIMTNTFMASTMLLVVAFVANFVLVPGNAPIHPSKATYLYGETPVEFKGVILLILYTFAFVMFLTSLRTLNHLSLLVGNEPDQIRAAENRDPVRFLAAKINGVESMTTYGRRAVYFSLPIFAWFYSPWFFAFLTVAIWVFFVLMTDFIRPAQSPKPTETARSVVTPTIGAK